MGSGRGLKLGLGAGVGFGDWGFEVGGVYSSVPIIPHFRRWRFIKWLFTTSIGSPFYRNLFETTRPICVHMGDLFPHFTKIIVKVFVHLANSPCQTSGICRILDDPVLDYHHHRVKLKSDPIGKGIFTPPPIPFTSDKRPCFTWT